MKKQFDIKYRPQIESGEYKVETREHIPVTILEWDKHIHGMSHRILGNFNDKIDFWDIKGRYNDVAHDCNLDLFIVTPEPELSEFEQEVSDIVEYCKKNGKIVAESYAKRHAKALLSIARKELENEAPSIIEAQSFKAGFKAGKAEALKEIEQDPESSYAFKRGIEYGKEKALKDLPKWRKFAQNINDSFSEQRICKELENSVMRVDVDGYCWVINREELNKLPKESEK